MFAYPQMRLVDMLGEFNLGEASGDDLDLAQDYLLDLVEDTEDPDIFRDALEQYAELVGYFAPCEYESRPHPAPVALFNPAEWNLVKDGHPQARRLYEGHYSSTKSKGTRRRRRAKLFVGPGEKEVLLTPAGDALFVWRLSHFRQDEQRGLECAVFRNTGSVLSSHLILEAENFARRRWPLVTRFFTYVDGKETTSRRSRRNPPGACFIHAGWRICGESSSGLVNLEKLIWRSSFLMPWSNAGGCDG